MSRKISIRLSDPEYAWLKERSGEGSLSDSVHNLIAACRTPERIGGDTVRSQAAAFLEQGQEGLKLNSAGWEKFRDVAQKLNLLPRDALWVIVAWALNRLNESKEDNR